MIRELRISGFKRFETVEFSFPGHLVLAGPNNTGKTTVLQAVASWDLALRRWRELKDFNRRQGYTHAPIARQAFASVPLRNFDLLWRNRRYRDPIEIEIRHHDGWSVTMEFKPESTEHISVRPGADADPDILREIDLRTVFIPPMTGVGLDEPVFQPAKIEQLLGIGRPGEALRNLLADASFDRPAWDAIQASIDRLFGYELLLPDSNGAHIVAEYKAADTDASLDIASAGSGFQQVLMLLAFLHTRPTSVLLLDEPDAHLHVILQDAIYHELRTVAARQHSQLIVATHSEVVINSVEPSELYVMLNEGPRRIEDTAERNQLVSALRVLTNTDIMKALDVRGVLYVEGHTDIDILRAWAARLGHRAVDLLTTGILWKPTVFRTRWEEFDAPGIRSHEHFEALQIVCKGLPGLELIDGDAHQGTQSTEITGAGLQRLRWRRYEIESYLLHPDALARFVEATVATNAAASHVEDMLAYWRDNFFPEIVREPLGDHDILEAAKARTRLIPPLLDAAGLHGLPYTRYHEIAQVMLPEEIHPEVVEKLDAICRAFGVEP